MRKKTAPTTRKHGQVSSQQEGGLIAQGQGKARQSAKDTYALDNLSHRTTQPQGRRARAEAEQCEIMEQPGVPCKPLLG